MEVFVFFNHTAPTEIYTLSLHDALPIWPRRHPGVPVPRPARPPAGPRRHRPAAGAGRARRRPAADGARPRSEEHTSELQSRHISYAVFCLKKKTPTRPPPTASRGPRLVG